MIHRPFRMEDEGRTTAADPSSVRVPSGYLPSTPSASFSQIALVAQWAALDARARFREPADLGGRYSSHQVALAATSDGIKSRSFSQSSSRLRPPSTISNRGLAER